MIPALAAGWLSLALAVLPCDTVAVDFGSAAPGHEYHYTAHYRNATNRAMSIAQEGTRCGGCPNLRLGYHSIGPGDSAEVQLGFFLPADAPDTVSQPVGLVTYQSDYGRRTYLLRFTKRPPALVRPSAGVIAVTTGGDGLLRGSVTLVNTSRQAVTVGAEGAPPGLVFDQQFPLAIGKGRQAAISFSCPPEVLLRHRSLTLRIVPPDKRMTERLSLPLVAE
ncbi:MAG: hypothetical protein MUF78_07095 [Candidatus Edwardsbacteria bacterium]|jgi:hypothetical protein|nr:hypothetical protein [Candidatus Edwardsbacteria bacterium]